MEKKIKIVTFNVRCIWDGPDGFISRMGLIYNKIEKEIPDVVAFQEVTEPILRALKLIMPSYIFVGSGRDAAYQGEGLYTAVNKDTMQVLSLDIFRLAPDQNDSESKFIDQSPYPRICVSTKLHHIQTKRQISVYNIHLDNEGKIARSEGMKQVLCSVKEDKDKNKNTISTIILGDFNEEPGGTANEICAEWKQPKMYDITTKLPGTFHRYGQRKALGLEDRKIDYIYVTEDLKENVCRVSIWDDKVNGHWLSDHYPIYAEFQMSDAK